MVIHSTAPKSRSIIGIEVYLPSRRLSSLCSKASFFDGSFFDTAFEISSDLSNIAVVTVCETLTPNCFNLFCADLILALKLPFKRISSPKFALKEVLKLSSFSISLNEKNLRFLSVSICPFNALLTCFTELSIELL